jgi:hypothetical protein
MVDMGGVTESAIASRLFSESGVRDCDSVALELLMAFMQKTVGEVATAAQSLVSRPGDAAPRPITETSVRYALGIMRRSHPVPIESEDLNSLQVLRPPLGQGVFLPSSDVCLTERNVRWDFSSEST